MTAEKLGTRPAEKRLPGGIPDSEVNIMFFLKARGPYSSKQAMWKYPKTKPLQLLSDFPCDYLVSYDS